MHLILAAILLLAAPGGRSDIYPLPLTAAESEAMVDSLGWDYIQMKAAFQPHWATAMGIAGYDGALARYTQRDVSRLLRKTFGIKRKLDMLPADSLSVSGWVDHQLLLSEIETLEYWFAGDVAWRRSPLPYTDAIIEGVVNLMLRGGEDSLSTHLASRLRAIPLVAADARTNVTDPIRLHCEVAASDLRAFLPFLDTESIEADPAIDVNIVTPEIVAGARSSVEAFAAYIDSLAAGAEIDFAPGAEAYSGYLKTAYMLDEPLYDLVAYAGRTLDQARSRRNEERGTFMGGTEDLPVDYGWSERYVRVGQDGLAAYQIALGRDLTWIKVSGSINLGHADSAVHVVTAPALEPLFQGGLYSLGDGLNSASGGRVHVFHPDAVRTARKSWMRWRQWKELNTYYPVQNLMEVRASRHGSPIRRYLRNDMARDGWAIYFSEFVVAPVPVEGHQRDQYWSDIILYSAAAITEMKIQTGEYTLDEAADFIAAETGRPRDLALQDARRYAVAPGSGIGYLLGRREILRLRERYEKAKRNSFDLKEFHDTLLSCGYLPPYLLSIEVMSKGMGRE